MKDSNSKNVSTNGYENVNDMKNSHSESNCSRNKSTNASQNKATNSSKNKAMDSARNYAESKHTGAENGR